MIDFGDEKLIVNREQDYIFHVNLDQDITDPQDYRELTELLQTARKEQIIKILFNTSGGNVDTALQLYNLIKDCNAKTIAEIYRAYSSGSMIAMACDEFNIKTFSSMMVHSTLWSNLEGNAFSLKNHNDFVTKIDHDIFKRIYKRILTDEEIETVLIGKEIWLYEDELIKRLIEKK